MIKIAICDDEIGICSQLENMLIKLLNGISLKYDIDVFYTGEGLHDELQHNTYDIIFLDIELPNSTGIDIGYYIREILKNDMIQIAYISANKYYANELFDFRPINFLHKPLEEKKVKKVLDDYIRITNNNEQIFTYKKGRTYHKVPINQIQYFENLNRKIKIVTINYEDEFYEHIEKIYERLKDYKFLFIHKSYIVNFRYIKDVNYDQVILTNNLVFPISQTKRKEIKNIYSNIMREII